MFGSDVDDCSIGIPEISRAIGHLVSEEFSVNGSHGWRPPNQMEAVEACRYFLTEEGGAATGSWKRVIIVRIER